MAAEDISAPVPRRRGTSDMVALLWLVPAALYYAFLLSAGNSGLFAPVNLGLTFNSMLLHLLQGRFDVDPSAIGAEGYLHDGAIYAYFGVFPALFRALFLWLPGFAHTDFTRLACLVAVSTMALFKVMSVRLAWGWAGGRGAPALLALMIAAVVLSGAQVQFLRPSIYQEVELWAGAMAAAFVYLVLCGVSRDEGFTPGLLVALAVAAGLALSTRVSNALGLYLAAGFIGLLVAWRQWPRLAGLAPFLAILAVFAAVTALINDERWGNPLVFADFASQLTVPDYPSRLPIFERYGLFNLSRIGFGLGYYFAPFWVLRDSAGQFLGAGFEGDFLDCCVELPPSSFFVTDPLLLGLAGYGLVRVTRHGMERRALIVAAGLGLLVPALMMLAAAGMTFRYRMEFYPLFELFALLGFAGLAARPAVRPPFWFVIGVCASVLAAHVMWLIYMLSPFGSPSLVMGSLGIVDFYKSWFQ